MTIPPRLRPYLPALVTIAIGVALVVVFSRPIANWFAGRPVLAGEASRPITIDAAPLRLGAAVRPALPHAGEVALYIGVGDRQGHLLPTATLTATIAERKVLDVEAAGDGRFEVEVTLPEHGPLEVHLSAQVPGDDATTGHAVVVLEAGRRGISVPGSLDGIAYHTCPMHPSIRSAAPGTCPICAMDLVPVTHEEIKTGAVRIDARRRQLIGVTTAVVDAMPLRVAIRTTGIATWDETSFQDVTARADGWVEELYADFTGKAIQAGEPLLSLYIPEIRAAELELIAAAKGRRLAEGTPLERTSGELQKAALDKLRALGVSDEDLRRILRTGRPEPALVMHAPVSGVVADKMVKRGSPVMANQPMLRLASLDPIWIESHVYEEDASLVTVGMQAEVSFPYRPGEPRTGTVTFIEPALDEATRTLRVRITLPNPDGALRPGMYADARLDVVLPERLVVPASAVIFAGPRRIVFVDEGGGRMRPHEVVLGVEGDDGYEVVSGLSAGQRVVTSGNFLIGAESRLRSALDAW